MNKTKQFPAWLQRTIETVLFLGCAWYLIDSWWVWATQLAG